MTHARSATEDIRYPFLDQRLVEFMFAVPVNQLFRPGERRSLLRRSLKNLLPKEILERHTKSGTGRCHVLTVRKHWNEIERILRSAISSRLGMFDQGAFRAALLELNGGDLEKFYTAAERLSKMPKKERQEWLRGLGKGERTEQKTVNSE